MSLTCSCDVSDHVKAVAVGGSHQRKGDDVPAAVLVEHGEHQTPQVGQRGPVQLHEAPLLAVVGPGATGHLADDHALEGRTRAGTAVLPQRGGRSYLRGATHTFSCTVTSHIRRTGGFGHV